MQRRTIVRAAAAAFSTSFAAARIQAQAPAFPTRPLRLVVGYPAGSSTDLMARDLADGMRALLGQPVLVENVPGGGATIAAARVAAAPPDGYTVYLAVLGHVLAPSLYATLPYDSVNDFSGIAFVSDTQFLIAVNPKVPGANLREFVAAAKAAPGRYSYGSSGAGSGNHLMMELFASQAGIRLLHVPYKSATEALNAVLAGDIDMTFFNAPPLLGHLQTGRLKCFGVGGKERSPFAPDVPTTAEAGYPDFEANSANFVLGPKGIPAPVLDRLGGAVAQVVASSAFRERIKGVGATPARPAGPAAVDAWLRTEVARWAPVIKASGARAD